MYGYLARYEINEAEVESFGALFLNGFMGREIRDHQRMSSVSTKRRM